MRASAICVCIVMHIHIYCTNINAFMPRNNWTRATRTEIEDLGCNNGTSQIRAIFQEEHQTISKINNEFKKKK